MSPVPLCRVAAVAVIILAAQTGLAGVAALADDGWKKLDGDAIRSALTERRLDFEGSGWQTFASDGGTARDSGKLTAGRWEVRDDKYCSVWPPSDSWNCFVVEKGAGGHQIRFTGEDGSVSTATYGD